MTVVFRIADCVPNYYPEIYIVIKNYEVKIYSDREDAEREGEGYIIYIQPINVEFDLELIKKYAQGFILSKYKSEYEEAHQKLLFSLKEELDRIGAESGYVR